MTALRLTLLLVVFSIRVAIAQVTADQILGKWLSESGRARIEIFEVANKYYGKIIWLKYPLNKEGLAKTDRNNPDPSLRQHKLIGLLLMKSLSFSGNEWKGGSIYDPENGKEYGCKISMNKDGTLHVRGYIGLSLIGRTTVWTKSQ